ncbi:MAG: hypothetical protein WDN00_17915 [Limisphaerales bacterium]
MKKEFDKTNESPLLARPFDLDINQCKQLCRRFHAYQQARYRWHEHLLEKHCERALGASSLFGYIPKATTEARASLMGWLSKQRGYAESLLVKDFRRQIRAKNSTLSANDKKSFHAEREHPSGHRYRTDSKPDEMGWLILTWPIWNFYKWRWTDIGEVLIKKFQFGDRDFLPTSRKRLKKALRGNFDVNDSMPAENAMALFDKYLRNPTRKEKEMHHDWESEVHIRRSASAFEELAKLAIGGGLAKEIEPRPKGRGTNQKPTLWNFAQQISA